MDTNFTAAAPPADIERALSSSVGDEATHPFTGSIESGRFELRFQQRPFDALCGLEEQFHLRSRRWFRRKPPSREDFEADSTFGGLARFVAKQDAEGIFAVLAQGGAFSPSPVLFGEISESEGRSQVRVRIFPELREVAGWILLPVIAAAGLAALFHLPSQALREGESLAKFALCVFAGLPIFALMRFLRYRTNRAKASSLLRALLVSAEKGQFENLPVIEYCDFGAEERVAARALTFLGVATLIGIFVRAELAVSAARQRVTRDFYDLSAQLAGPPQPAPSPIAPEVLERNRRESLERQRVLDAKRNRIEELKALARRVFTTPEERITALKPLLGQDPDAVHAVQLSLSRAGNLDNLEPLFAEALARWEPCDGKANEFRFEILLLFPNSLIGRLSEVTERLFPTPECKICSCAFEGFATPCSGPDSSSFARMKKLAAVVRPRLDEVQPQITKLSHSPSAPVRYFITLLVENGKTSPAWNVELLRPYVSDPSLWVRSQALIRLTDRFGSESHLRDVCILRSELLHCSGAYNVIFGELNALSSAIRRLCEEAVAADRANREIAGRNR